MDADIGWVPREVLERPLPLRQGVGNAHEAVSTRSAEAQAYYDQGLNYLHDYVWIEAARSFREALRRDPRLAMAWLGLSRVYSGLDDPAAARQALTEAQALVSNASEKERRRIALRAVQNEALADLADGALQARYKKAIDDALARDIDDPELWLLRGNAEEATAAGRGQRGGAASTAFYLEALRLAPDSSAAHHYLTHSYENIGQIDLALVHGEAYARLAPAIPHAHHMWGHDLRRAGRMDEAIAAFLRTDELERAYYAAESLPAQLDWHHVHNLDLLAGSYQHQGRLALAEQRLREIDGVEPLTEYIAFIQKSWPGFLLAEGRAAESRDAALRLTSGKWASTRAAGWALAGRASLAIGDREAGIRALAAARRELPQVPVLPGGINVSRGAVEPYVELLEGEIALRAGRADGRTMLEDVARKFRALPGPDPWIQTLFRLEELATLAWAVHDRPLVEFAAAQMLEHDAAYGGSHLAAARAARMAGDSGVERRELALALDCWREADPGHRGVSEARDRLAALTSGAAGEE